MDFTDYQKRAQETDQVPNGPNAVVVPLLGLAGEAATLQTEYKKLLRDGESHAHFGERVAEELGDLLWYVANIAHKTDLSLEEIAQQNLSKTRGRWLASTAPYTLFDERFPPELKLIHFRGRFGTVDQAAAASCFFS